MTWQYRVIENGETYSLHEVYFEGDKPVACTEALFGPYETPKELREDLLMMYFDTMHPMLSSEVFRRPTKKTITRRSRKK